MANFTPDNLATTFRAAPLTGQDESTEAPPSLLYHYRHFLLCVALIAVTSLTVVMAALETERASAGGQSPIPQDLQSLSPQGIAEEIERVVRGYLGAPTVEAKLAFVRRPSAVRPLMLDHYRGESLSPATVLEVDVIASLDAVGRPHPLFLAAAETRDGRLLPLMIEAQNGIYRIDWESHVGYSPMRPEAFLETPAGSTMWFRLHASQSDYKNYHFNEESDTVSLRLTFPGSPCVCYGYLSRSHPQFSEFARLLSGKGEVPLILTLRQESAASGSRRQVEITQLLQERWFVEEETTPYAEAWGRGPFFPGVR